MAVFQLLIENRTSDFDYFSFLTSIVLNSPMCECIVVSPKKFKNGQIWPKIVQNWPFLSKIWPFSPFFSSKISKILFFIFCPKMKKKIDFGRKKCLFCLCD